MQMRVGSCRLSLTPANSGLTPLREGGRVSGLCAALRVL